MKKQFVEPEVEILEIHTESVMANHESEITDLPVMP